MGFYGTAEATCDTYPTSGLVWQLAPATLYTKHQCLHRLLGSVTFLCVLARLGSPLYSCSAT